MSKSRKEFVKAYKVTSSNGFWAIIAATDWRSKPMAPDERESKGKKNN